MKTRIDSMAWVSDELELIRELRRERIPVHIASSPGPEVVIDGARLVHLCSNNYLGLASDPRLIEAAVEATRRFGTGSGASRLVSGGATLHRALEERIAAWKGTEDAVLFSSGYLANIGTIAALVGPGDRIYSDALNHASAIDGCRLSGAHVEVYAHASAPDLASRLSVPHDGKTLVVTDTVFSMDGDVAPLPEIVDLCDRYGAMLMVDEAHAAGVLGPTGAGAVEMFGLTGRVPVVMGTLSKALGAAGGYIAGSASLTSLLRNRARSFIFDTALPAAPVAAALAAIDIAESDPNRRARALILAQRVADELRSFGYEIRRPAACIVPLIIGSEEDALSRATRMRTRGAFAPAIRPPSVPAGSCRIRLTTMATHTDEMIERAVASLAR
ncbi:MAG: 8-amino-7-oxononanoate synthase [Actinomycetota bacterium]